MTIKGPHGYNRREAPLHRRAKVVISVGRQTEGYVFYIFKTLMERGWKFFRTFATCDVSIYV